MELNRKLSFEGWLNMTKEERWKTYLNWNAYVGEGKDIAMNVLERFKKEHSHIPKLRIHDQLGIYHGGTWVITVEHPFIFDHRRVPQRYIGIEVMKCAPGVMPEEFQIIDSKKEYVWAPERYEKFVDRCADEIRKELGNLTMTREEMLDALCHGGDFKALKEQCKQWEQEGKIPSYEGKD